MGKTGVPLNWPSDEIPQDFGTLSWADDEVAEFLIFKFLKSSFFPNSPFYVFFTKSKFPEALKIKNRCSFQFVNLCVLDEERPTITELHVETGEKISL